MESLEVLTANKVYTTSDIDGALTPKLSKKPISALDQDLKDVAPTSAPTAADIATSIKINKAIPANVRKSSIDWTEANLQALAYEAEGRFTALQISLATGLSVSAVRTLRKSEDFMTEVYNLQEKYRTSLIEIGLADKINRVKLYSDRLERMQQVVEEREAAATSQEAAEAYGIKFDEELAKTPGGKSGLMVHEVKIVGTGRNAMVLDVFSVDTSMLKTEADIAKQLAQELGQFTEKTESTIVRKLYIGVALDDI